MRLPLSLLCSLGAALAAADPLIDIPTARKMPYGTFRVEFAAAFDGSGTQLGWFNAGVGKSFEATVREEEIDGTRIRPTADLMYSVISALPGISPGFSVGVQDIANTTLDGRRGYVAVTFREPTQTFDFETPLDLTFGLSAGKKILPFVGLAYPLSTRAKILAEHSGYRASFGLEYSLSHSLAVRLLARGTKTLGDLTWSSRF